MAATESKLVQAVTTYLDDLRIIRASGGATAEGSLSAPLVNLLNAVGAILKPKVFCVRELANQGAGRPDIGLYAAKQLQRREPRKGQTPERGVVEIKSVSNDAWLTAQGDQVSRYWQRYRQVLVTNMRDFVLIGEDDSGQPVKLESFRLAESESEFLEHLAKPRAFAGRVRQDTAEYRAGEDLLPNKGRDDAPTIARSFGEYLLRVLSHRAALAEPNDLAWLLASYARDGLARVEAAGDAPQLDALSSALEEALGIRFKGDSGSRFFRSTLVQTLFYGVFSAWVLWARKAPTPEEKFNWHEAVWHLRAPVLRALFQQLSGPGRLQSLDLVEVLDWTAAALDRVDRKAFFSRFDEGEAVP